MGQEDEETTTPAPFSFIYKSNKGRSKEVDIDPTIYLIKFGYTNFTEEDLGRGRSPSMDPVKIKQGLKTFQEAHGLPITGEPDDATIEIMKKPRCGFRDPPKGRFVTVPYKWTKSRLSYSIHKHSAKPEVFGITKDAIRKAFKYWEKVTNLQFIEEEDNNSGAEFKIKFEDGDHGDGYYNAFDGPDGVLAHAFFPESGALHFDDQEEFTENTPDGTNLRIVATHEIGHGLGLEHSYDSNALMAPWYAGYVSLNEFKLNRDDILGIQSLYGTKTAVVDPETTTARVLETTSEEVELPVDVKTTPVEPAQETTTIENLQPDPITQPQPEPPKPETPEPQPQTPEPQPQTPEPQPQTPEPQPQTPKPQPPTPKPKPPPQPEPEPDQPEPDQPEPQEPDWKPRTIPLWPKPTASAGQPDPCTSSIDASWTWHDGATYFIRGRWLYRVSAGASSKISDKYPRRTVQLIEHAPEGINAAVYSPNSGNLIFFKDSTIWIYDKFGYLRLTENKTESDFPSKPLAAFLNKQGVICIIKGGNVYEFDDYSRKVTKTTSLSSYINNLPADVDGAAQDSHWLSDFQYLYFFKDTKYYKVFIRTMKVLPDYPKPMDGPFFGCSRWDVPK